MSTSTKGGSRYDRVKEILNSIQGKTVPDYQGYHAFWMSIETFTTVELYGQRMISPPIEGGAEAAAAGGQTGCCGNGESGKGDQGDGGDGGSAVEAVTTWPKGHNDPDCWPSGGPGGGGGGGGTQRSDSSGIIIGLKGEYPFDDTDFPPLLWGETARRATEAEIRTIADWIDDGCPAGEEKGEMESAAPASKISVSRDVIRELATGDRPHPVSKQCTNVNCRETRGLHVRKEISTLTGTELARLRNALECMFQYDDYWQDDRSFKYWARVHTDSCQHGWEQFLPWHRAYLYFFEQKLQDYDANISLPYWSWPDYADVNKTSFDNKEPDLGVIPEAYRCWLTTKAIDTLARIRTTGKDTPLFSDEEIDRLKKIAKTKYNSGTRLLRAAEIPYTLVKDPDKGTAAWSQKIRVLYDALIDINALWFPDRWPGAFIGAPANYPTGPDVENILELSAWPDFGGGPEYDHHFGALEQVHNGMHNFSGGSNPAFPRKGNTEWIEYYRKTLGIDPKDADPQNIENPPYGWMTDNRITAFDPMFWGHHSNVDRIWALWQERHAGTPENLDAVMAPWPITVKDTLSVRKLGYEYQRDTFHYRANSETAITRFDSENAGVSAGVLDAFRKAEIRILRVRRGNLPSVAINLFLNSPGANPDTPTENNDNYVGTIQTFHGSCYGGPGHCNLPLEKNRTSDHRPLDHHEPRNYRIDATKTVKRLMAKGDEDFSVQMVVTGLDGQPGEDALFTEGVSLNFLD